MQCKKDRNAYMREYMKKYRANMNEYTYKMIRERENQRLRAKYRAMTDEERQKYIEYQRTYHKLKQFTNE
jgi:hypothetical protein